MLVSVNVLFSKPYTPHSPPPPKKKIKLHEIEADKICAQQKNTLNPSQDAEAIRQGNTC